MNQDQMIVDYRMEERHRKLIESAVKFLFSESNRFRRVARVSDYVADKMYDRMLNSLIRAAKKYDESMGVAFITYAGRCILQSLRDMNYIRGFNLQQLPEYDSKDGPESIDAIYMDVGQQRIEHSDDVESLLSVLPLEQASLLRDHFGIGIDRPLSFRQIGKRWGLSRQAIEQRAARAIENLRELKNIKVGAI